MSFSQPVTLITGASRRIGACIARKLHEHQHQIVIHYNHSENDALWLCQELNLLRPNSAITVQADLNHDAELTKIIDVSVQWIGKLDNLIHNASLFIKDDALQNQKNWLELFQVNVRAPYELTKYAAPFLKKQSGSIIYITDIHAYKPLKQYAHYSQSKSALHMQMLYFARSLAPDIRVNAIAPGAIAWPEGDNVLSKQIQQQIIDSTLLKKHGKPDYIAQAVYDIMQNNFITGQTLKIDGGRSVN